MKVPKKILKQFGLRIAKVKCNICKKFVPEDQTELRLHKRFSKTAASYRPCCKDHKIKEKK